MLARIQTSASVNLTSGKSGSRIEGMKRESLIVLLVSEQTLPNIQFLKWIDSQKKSEEYKILFISTEKMEKKAKIGNHFGNFQTFCF